MKAIKESELENGKKEVTEPKLEEDEEPADSMFKVFIEKPEPKLVKMSRKNVCHITITHDKETIGENDDTEKLIEFYLNEKSPSWAS
jgi:hypothetical protein